MGRLAGIIQHKYRFLIGDTRLSVNWIEALGFIKPFLWRKWLRLFWYAYPIDLYLIQSIHDDLMRNMR